MEGEHNGVDDKFEDSPIEEVRLTVATTDDPTLPVLTFRAWFIGIFGCIIISVISMLTNFRQNPVYIPLEAVQFVCLVLGKMMATMLPPKDIRFPMTRFKFSLNPGPFNVKEHIVSYMIFRSGIGVPSAVDLLVVMKTYFRRTIHPAVLYLLLLTTANLSFGIAGLFMKLFVDAPEMWWPLILPEVALFRTLHEEEKSKGSLSRIQLFFLVFIVSFSYYIVPNYLFPSVSALSFVCWIWKSSVFAQQLGSGLNGLGLGSIGLDWSTATAYTASPLVVPFNAIVNMTIGFFLFTYIVVPIAYWSNSFKAKRFPVVSTNIYDIHGNTYNVTRVLDEKTFQFQPEEFENYSPMYVSIMRACSFGFGFACLTSSFLHIVIVHGRYFWIQAKKSFRGTSRGDIHAEMMKKYDKVPWWWFSVLLFVMLGLAILTCEGFGNEIQLRYWGVLLACLLTVVFIPPFAVLRATIAQQPQIGHLPQLVFGYLCPGKPLANQTFEIYSTANLWGALGTLSSFKLGHYMKIPPKAMFICQVIGSLVRCTTDLAATLWLFSSVENLCHPELLPQGSPWTCPNSQVAYNNMVTWGLIGPHRMFYPNGFYSKLFIFFLVGALVPIVFWLLSRAFPQQKWLGLVIVPTLFIPGAHMPPAKPVHYLSWIALGFLFNFVLYRRYKEWWAKYNYIISVGCSAGVSVMATVTMLALQMHGVNGIDWWGLDVSDHCPLATCPTEPGVQVEGCPVFA